MNTCTGNDAKESSSSHGRMVVKMIGFTLAVAVLIDATLVRIVIGPALLRIAGDWNWWPGGLRKPANGA